MADHREVTAPQVGPREVARELCVEGQPVLRLIDLIDLLDDHEPGESVQVTYDRGGRTQRVEVELGELPPLR